MNKLALLAVLFVSACAGGVNRDQDVEMKAVSQFNPEKYLGTWYEIARYPNWFEADCVSSKAEYSILEKEEDEEEGKSEDGEEPPLEIKVVNSCHIGDADGELREAEGRARYEDTGKFNVTFGPFYVSQEPNYWVLAQKNYKIAVIGEPSGKTGWILARDKTISDENINWALSVLEANGYDLKNIIRVPQK